MNQKVVIRRAGGLDQVVLEDGPDPVPGEGEVRIRVLAAGAAFGDVLLRRGIPVGRFPVTPGYDLVGVVDALGPHTSTVRVGDRVAALPGTGGQQQLICLRESELVAVPAEASAEKAVAVVLNHLTAYQLLTRAAGLKAGDAAFIYGLAGGLGSAMQEVATVLGVGLYGTASGGRIEGAARGGGVVFDRLDPDWITKAKAHRPGGFDAVFDPIGGESLYRSYQLLAPRGTLVMLGAAAAVQGKGSGKLKLLGTIARFVLLKLRPGSRRVQIFQVMKAKTSHPEYLPAGPLHPFRVAGGGAHQSGHPQGAGPTGRTPCTGVAGAVGSLRKDRAHALTVSRRSQQECERLARNRRRTCVHPRDRGERDEGGNRRLPNTGAWRTARSPWHWRASKRATHVPR